MEATHATSPENALTKSDSLDAVFYARQVERSPTTRVARQMEGRCRDSVELSFPYV